MFQAYGDKQGPLHGMLINTPYVTKDLLQSKRFQAQSLGTTYVYDFPEMFRQVLGRKINPDRSAELVHTVRSSYDLILFYFFHCNYLFSSRLWRNFGTPARSTPTSPKSPSRLSCSPSLSWFLMRRVSWCRWTGCQVATRLVCFVFFSLLHINFKPEQFGGSVCAIHFLAFRCLCVSVRYCWVLIIIRMHFEMLKCV